MVRVYCRVAMDLLRNRFGDDEDSPPPFVDGVRIAAGISNVNLTNHWMDHSGRQAADAGAAAPILDYMRVSPAGPLPVVFSLTTMGQRLGVCMTWRRAAFDQQQAGQLARQYIEHLAHVD